MKTIHLQGHDRSLNKVLYNAEGDLLFSAGKDSDVNVWYSINGERLGTYKGGKGVVWDLDVNWDTKDLVTGSGDNSCKLWDVETGVIKQNHEVETPVRACSFSYCGNKILFSSDKKMNYGCILYVYDIRAKDPIWTVNVTENGYERITAALWGTLDDFIITAHENGNIMQWDMKGQEVSNCREVHKAMVNDLQTDKNMIFLISASKDYTAKLLDIETLELLKTYTTERPVNSASISPIKDHVILGGGQEASQVTTSSIEAGQLYSRLFHLVYEEEFGRIKGHFSPINTVRFHPNGKSFATGGEDGFIILNEFDDTYFNYVM